MFFRRGVRRKQMSATPIELASSPRLPPGDGSLRSIILCVTEPHHPFAQGLRMLRPSLGLDRHGSARARWLTRQFAAGSSPARFISHSTFRDLPCARPQICRDSQETIPCAPKMAGGMMARAARTLAASRLAPANPGCAAGSPDVQQTRARGGRKTGRPRCSAYRPRNNMAA